MANVAFKTIKLIAQENINLMSKTISLMEAYGIQSRILEPGYYFLVDYQDKYVIDFEDNYVIAYIS